MGPNNLRRQICLVLNRLFPFYHHLISWHLIVLNSSLISFAVDGKVGIIGAFRYSVSHFKRRLSHQWN